MSEDNLAKGATRGCFWTILFGLTFLGLAVMPTVVGPILCAMIVFRIWRWAFHKEHILKGF